MANLYFEAQLDADQLRRELRDINQRFANMANNAQSQGDKMDATMKKVGAAMAGYFSLTAAQDFIGQVVNVRGEFQQLDIALQTMLGNKAKADALMANVVQLAAKTPFSLTELGQGAKQLLAFKTPAEEIPDTLKRIGDVAAGVSVPVGDLIAAYGKVSAKGKMQAEELNQFAERGVPIISELAKVIGTTDDKIYKMAEDGKIGFSELQQAIRNMTDETGMFYNLMEKQSTSLTGLVSNLGDAWDRMLNDIGKSNEGVIADVIGGLTNMVDNYEDVLKVLGTVVATYGAYRAAIMLAATAQKAQAVAGAVQAWLSLAGGIRSAKDAQIAFSLATKMNPWGLAAAGIAALVTGLVLFKKEAITAEAALTQFQSSAKELESLSATDKLIEEYDTLSKNVNRSTEEQTRYNELLKTLAPLYDDAITKVDEYGNAVVLSAEKMRQANAMSRVEMMDGLEAQLEVAKKAKEAAQQNANDYKSKSSRTYESVDRTTGRTYELRRSPEEVISNQTKFNETTAEIRKLDEVINGLTTKLDVLNGKIPDYFSKYASLLIDVSSLTKDKLIKLQNEIGSVMSIDIKDPQFKARLSEQSTAIANALNDIKAAENKANAYDGKEYRKKLSEQEKAYADYAEAMKNARPEDIKALEQYYANLRKQGDDYKAYLENQLKSHKDNVDATAAIYKAAGGANIILNGKDEFNSMSSNTDTSKIKVTATEKKASSVPLQFDKLAAYSEKAKANAEKMRKEMGFLSKAELGAGLINGANAMNEMAQYAGEMDEEFGVMLSATADIAGNIGNMMSGNPLQQITGAIGLISTLSNAFDNSAAKQLEAAEAAEIVRQKIELQNIALEYQLDLLAQTSGEERITAQNDTLNLIKTQEAELNEEVSKFSLIFKDGYTDKSGWKWLSGGSSEWDEVKSTTVKNIDELAAILNGSQLKIGSVDNSQDDGLTETALSDIYKDKNFTIKQLQDAGFSFENLEEAEKYLEQYKALVEQRAALYEQFTATSSSEITDSIIEGFRNGESAIESFSNMFEDTMRESLIESFKNTVVLAEAQKVYDMMKSSISADGVIDTNEMAAIKEQAASSAQTVQSGMEQYNQIMQEVFGENLFESTDSSESGLTGAVRAEMTEETASRLAGLFNVMSLDTRSIRDNMSLNIANNVQQLNQLLSIESHTGRTAVATEATVEALNNAVSELRAIKKNTTSNTRGEG